MEKGRLKEPPADDNWVPHAGRKRRKGVYRLEIRAKKPSILDSFKEWTTYWTNYETEKARDQALEALTHNDYFFEYRIKT